MTRVSLKSIEKAIDKVDNLDDNGLEKTAETFALAQQTLLGYVMSAPIEYENEKLEGLLIYYYCLISEAFTQEQVILNQISDNDIEEFEEPFFQMLDEYFEKEDEETLFSFCDQEDLIRFMMVEITTADDDGTSLDDETATQLFIVTTAMITLMGRAIKS